MAMKNSTILDKVWLAGTNDYQQNVPLASQQGIAATVSFLMDPAHMNWRNQFLDILVNRVGFEYVHNRRFNNPLRLFKKPKLNYGNIVEEIAPAWVRAHSYEDDAETLLKMHRPQLGVAYHSQNRRDMYPISINEPELRSAFEGDYGLNKLIASLMQTPYNSDEYDEMNIMLNLIALYETTYGFYKVQLNAAPTDEASGKAFLAQARAMAGKLTIPSAAYNADLSEYGIPAIPTFVSDADELILITDFETQASLDVNTLAGVFNIDFAEVKYRVKQVPEIPVPGAVAILTTTDFFQQYDTVYQNTSFWNAETLTTNYYLHHWGVYSVSPFVPAVMFTTSQGTDMPTITQDMTSINLAANGDIVPGGTTQLTLTANGTLTANPENAGVPKNIEIAPDTAAFSITLTNADGTAKTINSRTYIDDYGVLHLQKSGVKAGDKVTVNARSYYINPNGNTPDLKTSLEITVAD